MAAACYYFAQVTDLVGLWISVHAVRVLESSDSFCRSFHLTCLVEVSAVLRIPPPDLLGVEWRLRGIAGTRLVSQYAM